MSSEKEEADSVYDESKENSESGISSEYMDLTKYSYFLDVL